LRSYAASVREAHPAIDDLTPRQKAITVAEHLLEKQWIGIQDNRHYHSLDHMFLGVSLFSENKNSVPLISAVTYCYVARQFDLRAAPCSYPFHVHALVQPPPGLDLDGNSLEAPPDDVPSKLTHLYMDPFNSAEPVPLSKLEAQLRFINPTATPLQHMSYLSTASPRDLSIRAAHNILASPSHDPGPPLHHINPNLATYGALFSLVMLPSHPLANPGQMRQHLAVLTQHFLEYFDLDIHLFETHVLPLAYSLPDSRAYRNLISQLKDADNESRHPKYRSNPVNTVVEFSVGQVFRHRRRGYLAVIYGWDPYCRMQEQWITMNQVDRLPNGRHQPFYNVLVEDESTRYVAQENVVLLGPEEITPDHVTAFPIEIGKWFKRFDAQSGTFISNVRDEYPDG
jgi:F-box protein 21